MTKSTTNDQQKYGKYEKNMKMFNNKKQIRSTNNNKQPTTNSCRLAVSRCKLLVGSRQSFTLIELLVVIALIAVLAVAVILSLNPSELLKQGRDSTRLSDLQNLNKSLSWFEADTGGTGFMGSSSVIYVSIPDTTSTCSNLGLPTPPSGYSYRCVTQQNLQKTDGSGWIPVNFNQISFGKTITKLPIDPINQTSTGNYYTYVANAGGLYEIDAFTESNKYKNISLTDGGDSDNAIEIGSNLNLTPLTFPNNWVKVPGNSTYGTSDFWVMKYEAKYSKNGGGADDANNCYYTAGYDTWDWGKSGTDCPSSWSNTNVISSPYGSPIAGVTHNEAKTICQSLGGHLITNQEWMTIARNAEQVPQNWSGGLVGSGCLFRGNVGGNDSCGYDGADPEKGTNRNPKAKLILSNGSEIWDFAGNIWEHVQKDSNDTLVNNLPTDGGAAGWRFIEHTAITGYGDLSYNEIRPSNSSWNSTQGMGMVYTYNSTVGSRVLYRGGGWYFGSYAGAFALGLNWDTGTQDNYVGFRCAR
jgi:prepilin-type N-terminal cleavage/methylation domain-containing protein